MSELQGVPPFSPSTGLWGARLPLQSCHAAGHVVAVCRGACKLQGLLSALFPVQHL